VTAPRVWSVVLLAALAAPLVTWLGHLGPRLPWLGLPPYPEALGMDLYPSHLYFFLLFGALAVLIGAQDKWLGLTLAYLGLVIFWRGMRLDPTHSVMFAVGAFALWAMRQTPPRWWPIVATALSLAGAVQAVYMLQQAWFKYDLLWGPLFGGVLNEPQYIRAIGTIGSVDAAGAYVAITAALMPAWLLPLAGIAVWQSHSLGALLALVVALGLRYRHLGLRVYAASLALIAAGVGFRLSGLSSHSAGWGSFADRLTIWTLGVRLAAASDPAWGWGLGGWITQVPQAQICLNVWPTKEVWAQAHSEPIQWACETGLVGLLLLSLWCYSHRAAFVTHTAWGAATAAAAVNALVFFPFHQVALALLAIVVTALATAPAGWPPADGAVTT